MRKWGAAALLALLVLVDIVLITLAVGHARNAGAVPGAPPSKSSSKESPKASASPSASPTAKPVAKNAGKVIIVGVNAQRAWRAVTTQTECRTGAKHAKVDYTTDGGTTWTKVDGPLVMISGMGLVGADMVATGLDDTCSAATYAFSSTKHPVTSTETLDWGVAPHSDKTLDASGRHAPSQPCADGILDVATDSPSYVTVLCRSGAVMRTTDAGTNWTKQAEAKGALAIATDGKHTVYTVTSAHCGLLVSRAGGPTGAKCVPGPSGPADLSIVDGTQWLATGTRAWSSPLGG